MIIRKNILNCSSLKEKNYHFQAELLEQLGFELPSSIRDVGIQQTRLHQDVEVTEKMINQYNDIVDKLEETDVCLFQLN